MTTLCHTRIISVHYTHSYRLETALEHWKHTANHCINSFTTDDARRWRMMYMNISFCCSCSGVDSLMSFIGAGSYWWLLFWYWYWFLANVNVYVTFAMPSQIRLSVICLSVTLVHPTQPVEMFGNFFHHTIAHCPGTLVFWRQNSLVGDAPFPLKFAFKVTHPPFKQQNFDRYRLIALQPW